MATRGQRGALHEALQPPAAQVLRAVPAGSLTPDQVEALVGAVLDQPLVAAALALRDAEGAHVARRAVTLAALVIEQRPLGRGGWNLTATSPGPT